MVKGPAKVLDDVDLWRSVRGADLRRDAKWAPVGQNAGAERLACRDERQRFDNETACAIVERKARPDEKWRGNFAAPP
jgi:hypothetical protein